MRKEDLYYDSRDNLHKIHAVKWMPDKDEDIKCIVQLIHGMAEHIERYDEFASFLADNGVLVVGNDHLGHGKSMREDNERGFFAENDPVTVVVRDVHRLKKKTQEAYPGKPYYIFGHSMGSLILRTYLTRYGKGIDGAIISGTASKSSLIAKPGKLLLSIMKAVKGGTYRSAFAESLVNGNPNRKIDNPRTAFDWLSTDDELVDKYVADEKCGFLFTLNGHKSIVEMVDSHNNKKLLAKIPDDLPILFISGAEDPVGDYGVGVNRAASQLKAAGKKNVEVKIYEGKRHELLNETIRKEVFKYVYDYIMALNSGERVQEKYAMNKA